ncbi:MAG: DUF4398 domain-containing protein [Gammaproteobacteria bacterium]
MFTRIAVLITALVLAACASAPVQEISNARQAVAAAQQAGADRSAPKQMAEAQRLLRAAQAALDDGNYSASRQAALRARDEAVKALQISQRQGPRVPPRPEFPVFSLC